MRPRVVPWALLCLLGVCGAERPVERSVRNVNTIATSTKPEGTNFLTLSFSRPTDDRFLTEGEVGYEIRVVTDFNIIGFAPPTVTGNLSSHVTVWDETGNVLVNTQIPIGATFMKLKHPVNLKTGKSYVLTQQVQNGTAWYAGYRPAVGFRSEVAEISRGAYADQKRMFPDSFTTDYVYGMPIFHYHVLTQNHNASASPHSADSTGVQSSMHDENVPSTTHFVSLTTVAAQPRPAQLETASAVVTSDTVDPKTDDKLTMGAAAVVAAFTCACIGIVVLGVVVHQQYHNYRRKGLVVSRNASKNQAGTRNQFAEENASGFVNQGTV